MIKTFKVILSLSLLFLLFAVIFFFWASSQNHEPKEYAQLIENQYTTTIDEDSIYSIVTYNIGYLSGMTNNLPVPKEKSLYDENLKKVYREFEQVKADIICFQEIDYASARSFYVNQQEELEKLGYNYTFQGVNWDINYLPFPGNNPTMQYGEMYSGQSILSKYKLKDTERMVLERVGHHSFLTDAFYLDRLAQVSKVMIENKEVILINVHLEAAHQSTRRNQTEAMAKLFNKYKDDYPVLLVGDFNSDIKFENSTIKTLLEIPGIASASFDSQNTGKTYPSRNPTERLDYIFYNEKFIALKSAKILTSFGEASDHLPVLMEFDLR